MFKKIKMKIRLTIILVFSLLSITFTQAQTQYPAQEDTALVIGYDWSKKYLADIQEVFVKIPIARKCKLKLAGGYSDFDFDGEFINTIQTRVTGKFAKVGITKSVVSTKRHTSSFTVSGMFIQYKDRAIINVGETFVWPTTSVRLEDTNHKLALESTMDLELKIIAGLHLGISARATIFNNAGEFNDMEEKTGLPNFTYVMRYIPGIGRVQAPIDIGLTASVLYKIAWEK